MPNTTEKPKQTLAELYEQVPEPKLTSEEKSSIFVNGGMHVASSLLLFAAIEAALDHYSAHSLRSAAKDITKRLVGDPLSVMFALAAGYFATTSARDQLKQEKKLAGLRDAFLESNGAPVVLPAAPTEPIPVGKHTAAIAAERSGVSASTSRLV